MRIAATMIRSQAVLRSLTKAQNASYLIKPTTCLLRRSFRTTSCCRAADDNVHSFSDAHFGQERDRESRRAGRRSDRRYQTDDDSDGQGGTYSEADHEHAVISTFDLFSIGIGPSSSHTVGPMRAGKIFVTDLERVSLLEHVDKIRISLYGSLAATGEGHMTPSALLLGLECADVETVETEYVPRRFEEIKAKGQLHLGKHSTDSQGRQIKFDYAKDLIWEWGKTLPLHSNGMRLTVFDKDGTMLATNDLFSVGGGFVVNGALSTAASSKQGGETASNDSVSRMDSHPADLAENMFYKEINREDAASNRRTGMDVNTSASGAALPAPASEVADPSAQTTGETSVTAANATSARSPPYPFRDAKSLIGLCKKHNMTIAQIVYENERAHGYTDEEIQSKLLTIWNVMDASIHQGVKATDETLPGSLKLNRRAPALYRRLTRGLYPSPGIESSGQSSKPALSSSSSAARSDMTADSHKAMSSLPSALTSSARDLAAPPRSRGPPRVHGSFHHPVLPSPPRRTAFPAIDYLTVYAMAVNETNAAGGRIVTAPTNGAAGIIPAVLKYTLEFQSDDAERDIFTFLLTAAAIGMLYKRGATISAAEGGCMAEVGVACSMSAAAFAACMGARPETIEQAAEIGIEHNLGLTCDPIGGLVQAPCIERNALGAIKGIASANLALSSEGTHKVSLDEAIRAMRLTAQGMRNEFKETSLSGLATSVSLNIPVSVPDC